MSINTDNIISHDNTKSEKLLYVFLLLENSKKSLCITERQEIHNKLEICIKTINFYLEYFKGVEYAPI